MKDVAKWTPPPQNSSEKDNLALGTCWFVIVWLLSLFTHMSTESFSNDRLRLSMCSSHGWSLGSLQKVDVMVAS